MFQLKLSPTFRGALKTHALYKPLAQPSRNRISGAASARLAPVGFQVLDGESHQRIELHGHVIFNTTKANELSKSYSMQIENLQDEF